jgi:hypothetical protein
MTTDVAAVTAQLDAMAQCQREIAAAVEKLEAAVGMRVLTAQLMYCNRRGYGEHHPGSDASHRTVIIAYDDGQPVPWVTT